MTTHIDHLMHSWAWHFHMQNLQKLPESYLCGATPQNPVCRDCPKNMEKDDLFEAWRTWIKKNNRKNRREKSLFTLKGIWNLCHWCDVQGLLWPLAWRAFAASLAPALLAAPVGARHRGRAAMPGESGSWVGWDESQRVFRIEKLTLQACLI